jgi:hypothetical protein
VVLIGLNEMGIALWGDECRCIFGLLPPWLKKNLFPTNSPPLHEVMHNVPDWISGYAQVCELIPFSGGISTGFVRK